MKAAILLGAMGLVAGITSGANAQTVANGNFETPRISGYAYRVGGASFTFEGGPGGPSSTFIGGTGITAPGSAFTSANPGNTSQVAFLQGKSDSYFYESVDITKPGAYVVDFSAAQRGAGSPAHTGMDHQDFAVLINGSDVGTFQPSSVNYTSFTTYAFTVDKPESITLEFQGIDSTGDDETAFIDDVSIQPLPYVKRRPLTP